MGMNNIVQSHESFCEDDQVFRMQDSINHSFKNRTGE
jgi:hypothetical protein